MGTGAHQCEFHLILNVLDRHRATAGQTPSQRIDDAGGQLHDLFANPRRIDAVLAFDGQESLGNGKGDLFRLKRYDRTVTTDHFQTAVGLRRRIVGNGKNA